MSFSCGIHSLVVHFTLGGSRLCMKKLLLSDENVDERNSQFAPICQRLNMPSTQKSHCAVCENDEDLKVCSGCGGVSYCSVGHQKQHWKQHKEACQPYRVRTHDSMDGSTRLSSLHNSDRFRRHQRSIYRGQQGHQER
jgi:MYND finger